MLPWPTLTADEWRAVVRQHALEDRYLHLPGQHEQETHGHRGGPDPAERRQRSSRPDVYRRKSDGRRIARDIEAGHRTKATPEAAVAAVLEMASHENHANLERLQVEGENAHIFAAHARELKREDMPQLPESQEEQQKFFEYLAQNDVRVKFFDADPRELMATQNQLDSVKVGQILKYVNEHQGKLRGGTGPLFVSREKDVIDGHHRWATMAVYALTHAGTRVPVAQLSVDIDRALALSNEYGRLAKIPKAGFAQPFKGQRAAAAVQADDEGFAPIVIGPPPPDAPPPPDDEHPWNWINGRWIYIPTDTADGVPTTLDLPEGDEDDEWRGAEYDESKHPRDERGRWTDVDTGAAVAERPSKSAVTSGPLHAFATNMQEHGYHTTTFEQLPDELRNSSEITWRQPASELTQAEVDGINDGLKMFDDTELGDLLHDKVQFLYADYDPPASASTTTGGGGAWVSLNANHVPRDAALTSPDGDYTLGMINATRKGLTGDDRVREVYKHTVVHEIGHVADAAMGGALTGLCFDSVMFSGHGGDAETLKNFLRRISPYAVNGGPKEFAAEVFSAAVLGYPLPKDLHPARDIIRQNILGKKNRKTA